ERRGGRAGVRRACRELAEGRNPERSEGSILFARQRSVRMVSLSRRFFELFRQILGEPRRPSQRSRWGSGQPECDRTWAGTLSANQSTTLEAAPISAIRSCRVQANAIMLAASPHFDAAARKAAPQETSPPRERSGGPEMLS